jgi:hypothetical protein
VYPDGTIKLVSVKLKTPKKSPEPKSCGCPPPVPKLAGLLNVDPVYASDEVVVVGPQPNNAILGAIPPSDGCVNVSEYVKSVRLNEPEPDITTSEPLSNNVAVKPDDGIGVSVGVGVLVGVSLGVFVGVLVGVSLGVFVGVSEGVLVGVSDGVGVFVVVSVGVLVGVSEGVFVGVSDGVNVGV